jgi:acylglycerol lipase
MAGSTDKTLKLYEGHFHDLLNDVDKEVVMADILSWIDARIPAARPGVASPEGVTTTKSIAQV